MEIDAWILAMPLGFALGVIFSRWFQPHDTVADAARLLEATRGATTYANRVEAAAKARTAYQEQAEAKDEVVGLIVNELPALVKKVQPNATEEQIEKLQVAASSRGGQYVIKKLLKEAGL